jgi:hypothetical protein
MFNRFGTFDAFRRHDPAPALPISNDNRGRACLPARAQSRQRLACYWRPSAERRLACHWEVSAHAGAGAREQGMPADTEATPAWMLRVA